MIVQFDTVLTLTLACARLASLSLDKSSTINMGSGSHTGRKYDKPSIKTKGEGNQSVPTAQ